MRRFLEAGAALVAAAGLAATASAQFHPNVIYGPDTRVDLYQVKDPKVLALADSTIALFQASDVTVKDGAAKLATQNYGESSKLCKEEPFIEQGTGAFCSGSLVAPDVIMTAGHCVPSAEECAGIKFVFGFDVKQAGVQPASVPESQVYGCAQLIGREQNEKGADWALVRLDRKVADHQPVKLNLGGAIANGAPLMVIGHPAGLPTKVAGGAHVRDASPEGYFVANLDTYAGNSGSAVFNESTGLVEGVLVRGEQDFVPKGDCFVSKVCPVDGCRGEDVTKISVVAPKIPVAQEQARVAALQPMLAQMLSQLQEAHP
jgi:hypothetical protein